MKNRIFCLILTLIGTLCAYAQTTILGIPVGETYSNAERMLSQRYGYKLREENGNLILYNFEMGGVEFQSGELKFQWKNGVGRLCGATFQDWSSPKNVNTLKAKRDLLRQLMSNKYDIEDDTNDQGFKKFFFFGQPENGVWIIGSVDIIRGKGNDGVQRCYLYLFYFPKADFIEENSDF